jgi:hypothetical protein
MICKCSKVGERKPKQAEDHFLHRTERRTPNACIYSDRVGALSDAIARLYVFCSKASHVLHRSRPDGSRKHKAPDIPIAVEDGEIMPSTC